MTQNEMTPEQAQQEIDELSKRTSALTQVKQDLQRRYETSLGLIWHEAAKHEDAQFIDGRIRELVAQRRTLEPVMICANLERFGLEDLDVIVILRSRNARSLLSDEPNPELGRKAMKLSEACALRYHGLADERGVPTSDVDFNLDIEFNGKLIGSIRSDGDFQFSTAPDVRTVLGWRIATDLGRVKLIEDFDLDTAAQKIADTILGNAVTKEVFFDVFSPVLQGIIVYEKTSRFADGYCSALTTLWRVGTRQFRSVEHPGYPFVH